MKTYIKNLYQTYFKNKNKNEKWYTHTQGEQKTIFSKFSKRVNPSLFLKFIFCIYFWVYIFKMILWRWGLKHATFSITKRHQSLDMNFISIKTHEMVFWYFCYFQERFTLKFFMFKDGTLNFHIFKKGTHPTLISR